MLQLKLGLLACYAFCLFCLRPLSLPRPWPSAPHTGAICVCVCAAVTWLRWFMALNATLLLLLALLYSCLVRGFHVFSPYTRLRALYVLSSYMRPSRQLYSPQQLGALIALRYFLAVAAAALVCTCRAALWVHGRIRRVTMWHAGLNATTNISMPVACLLLLLLL